MQHKIRLTADWTNPETGEAHKAGETVSVHDWQLRLEGAQGLTGKYTLSPATPPQTAHTPRSTMKRANMPPTDEARADAPLVEDDPPSPDTDNE